VERAFDESERHEEKLKIDTGTTLRPIGEQDAVWEDKNNLTGCRRAGGADADGVTPALWKQPEAVLNLEKG
jgi:hypothetical protein